MLYVKASRQLFITTRSYFTPTNNALYEIATNLGNRGRGEGGSGGNKGGGDSELHL